MFAAETESPADDARESAPCQPAATLPGKSPAAAANSFKAGASASAALKVMHCCSLGRFTCSSNVEKCQDSTVLYSPCRHQLQLKHVAALLADLWQFLLRFYGWLPHAHSA